MIVTLKFNFIPKTVKYGIVDIESVENVHGNWSGRNGKRNKTMRVTYGLLNPTYMEQTSVFIRYSIQTVK